MLCAADDDKKITFSDICMSEQSTSALWEAEYTFSKNGRSVHNKIDAVFVLQDGKIIKHTDHFHLHSWAKQALGMKGFLLVVTKFVQRKLQAQNRKHASEVRKTQLA